MYSLQNKVVLITGAANGIGASVVRELLTEGVKHIRALDIDEATGESLKAELNQIHGDKVKFSKCDVTVDVQLFKAFHEVIEEFGYVDIVINNAAIADESNSEMIRKQIEINYLAVVNGTLKALELMRKDRGGRGGTVINMSSLAALVQQSPTIFVYCGTKSAVLQFSVCMGKEPYYSTTGVRVITVCFGCTNTAILPQIKSFDKAIDVAIAKSISEYPEQSPESAAKGVLKAIKIGNSGSTWLVNKSKAKDITSNVDKAYAELSKTLEED